MVELPDKYRCPVFVLAKSGNLTCKQLETIWSSNWNKKGWKPPFPPKKELDGIPKFFVSFNIYTFLASSMFLVTLLGPEQTP